MYTNTCEVCGKRAARYVCQNCGRKVCESCLETTDWSCSHCHRFDRRAVTPSTPFPWPFKLFILGFLLIFAGTILIIFASVFMGAPNTIGAVVFIGPFPIILGAGPHSILAILLASVLTILGVILYLSLRKYRA